MLVGNCAKRTPRSTGWTEPARNALVIRKARFVLGDLLDLPMQAFDRICGIDQSPDFRRELEEGRNLAPVAFPGGGDMRIGLVPFLRVWLSFTKNVS